MAVPLSRLMSRQTGVALITALLVVALATVAAAAMATRLQLDVRRTANLFDGDQAYVYALGVESWARVVLTRDSKDVDKLDEDWAKRLSPVAVPGGQVDGYVTDLQGRFNLNNLVDAADQPSEPHVRYFERLLRVLGLNDQLVGAVIDWRDHNTTPDYNRDGAEDDYYLSTSKPYRAANRDFQSTSELRLVKGVDAAIWNKLAPYICALPATAQTRINVNTAPAPVLAAVVEGLTLRDGEQLVEARGQGGHDDINDFLLQPLISANEDPRDKLNDLLGKSSSYFLLRGEVTVGTARARLFSVLERGNTGVQTLARTQGTW